jgi:hypothetical protein
MFGHLLGLGSFDSPKRLLGHKEASLPITINGVEVILTSTIALTVNWALVALVIVVRFMVDQHLFLLETLT